MIAEENERIAARWVDVWNRADLDALDTLYAPNFVYHMRFPNLSAGIPGERQVITMLHGAFPDLEIITEDIIVSATSAVVRWTMPGTHLGNFAASRRLESGSCKQASTFYALWTGRLPIDGMKLTSSARERSFSSPRTQRLPKH